MKLHKLTIRVPKDQASFVYFQFEAHENIVFHSTLDSSRGMPYRDIQVFFHTSVEGDARHILSTLKDEFPIDFLEDKIVDDSEQLLGLEESPKGNKNVR